MWIFNFFFYYFFLARFQFEFPKHAVSHPNTPIVAHIPPFRINTLTQYFVNFVNFSTLSVRILSSIPDFLIPALPVCKTSRHALHLVHFITFSTVSITISDHATVFYSQ